MDQVHAAYQRTGSLAAVGQRIGLDSPLDSKGLASDVGGKSSHKPATRMTVRNDLMKLCNRIPQLRTMVFGHRFKQPSAQQEN